MKKTSMFEMIYPLRPGESKQQEVWGKILPELSDSYYASARRRFHERQNIHSSSSSRGRYVCG